MLILYLAVRAVFTETANSELNQVLNTIQEKIILPAYLPAKQRELVFDPKMRQHLQQNPVVIELDGLEHKFSTIDRFKDVPNSKKVFHAAVGQMQTKEDWENLGTLLTGYNKAGIKLKRENYARAVRLAGESGSIYTIIDCAKQAQKTGLALYDKECLVQLLVQINNKISKSSDARRAKETEQAAKWTEIVLDLLHRPEHEAKQQPHRSAFVRGLALYAQASAIKAKQQAGEAIEADLKTLTENVEYLVSIWSRRNADEISKFEDFADLSPFYHGWKPGMRVLPGTSYVAAIAQCIKGLSLARELLPDAASSLKAPEVGLQQHLDNYVAESFKQRAGPTWAADYEAITGQKPNWPPSPEKPAKSA